MIYLVVKKIFFILAIVPLISYSSKKNNVTKYEFHTKDINNFSILVNQFVYKGKNLYKLGRTVLTNLKSNINNNHQHTIYTTVYCRNEIIPFKTIGNCSFYFCLYKKSIIITLLINDIFNEINSYLDRDSCRVIENLSFYQKILSSLIKQVENSTTQLAYMLQTILQSHSSDMWKILSVSIQFVSNHMDEKVNKYLKIVRRASKQYGIDQSLILAIIQTESGFNPCAVSHSDALGLMQIVQHSAGRDVFKTKRKWGQPSRNYLLDPENNIDIGTAYLSILQNSYLVDIINPISRKYAVIAAYNGGAGNVLRTFSSKKNQAFQIINRMQPEEVYHVLSTHNPSIESRDYLSKVNQTQKSYQN